LTFGSDCWLAAAMTMSAAIPKLGTSSNRLCVSAFISAA
jgi:hypothetical protein